LNIGGWLLLSLIFSGLLLLVQRTERKRRNVVFIILLLVAVVVWRYALYRMFIENCTEVFQVVCTMQWHRQLTATVAYNTMNMAIFTALVFNLLFWIFFGRSNPPGSSESIQVFGMND
jgi:hypothetical protein